MSEPVRVVLVGMPAMLRQILSEVVGRAAGLDAVADLPRQRLGSPVVLELEPDFLIAGANETTDHEIASLLYERCRVRVLTLSPDGRSGALHEMRPRHTTLGELSTAAVVEVAMRRHPLDAT